MNIFRKALFQATSILEAIHSCRWFNCY